MKVSWYRRIQAWTVVVTVLMSVTSLAGDPVVIESRAPGSAGGGQGMSDTIFPGHSIRILERVEVTALGGYLSAGSNQTIFAALYRLGTPNTLPDVNGESNLIGTTLIDIPGGSAGNYSGAFSAVLEPGWYAIVLGTGRYGAPSSGFGPTMPNTGTPGHPDVWSLSYTMNSGTGARTFSSATTRHFALGQVLPPSDPPDTEFLYETATPAARWSSSSYGLSNGQAWGNRFEISRNTRITEAGGWFSHGSGQIYAAIVALSGPGANPPPPGSAAFGNQLRGLAMLPVGGQTNNYTTGFDDVLLTPGHYAVLFGTGALGASGTVSVMSVTDQLLVSGAVIWTGNFWANTDIDTRFFVRGEQQEWQFSPSTGEFGDVPIIYGEGLETVTITNLTDSDLTIDELVLSGPDSGLFDVPAGSDDCTQMTLSAAAICSFQITYYPEAIGEHTASLELISDATLPGYVLELAGNGVEGEPALSLSGGPLEFLEVGVGETSTGLGLTIASTGTADLEIDSIVGPDAPFAVAGGTCQPLPLILEPGTDCELELNFSPTSPGPAASQVNVVSNALVAADPVTLSGLGAAPVLESLPGVNEILQFGEVVENRPSAPVIIDLGNTDGVGSSPLSDLEVVSVSVDNSVFSASLLDAGPFPAGFGPDGSADIELICMPTEVGSVSGTLTVQTNDPLQPTGGFSWPLSCEGIPEPATIQGTITTLGYCDDNPAPLDQATITVIGQTGDPVQTQSDALAFYELEFPADLGPVSVAVSAEGQLGQSVDSLDLSAGQTVEQNFDLVAELGCSEVDPAFVGVVVIPGQSPVRHVTLSNDGAAISSFQVIDQPEWLEVEPQSGSLSVGGNQLLSLRFPTSTSTGPGSDEENLIIEIDEGNGPESRTVSIVRDVTEPVDSIFADRFDQP